MAEETDSRLVAPCVVACPAEVDVPRYIGYVALGRFKEAEAVVREAIPLPVACGLICYRPCEPWCRRGIMEQPVAINAIKRAASEHNDSRLWRLSPDEQKIPETGREIAIVGGGPTGLTSAYYLANRKGHNVTLFEAMPELGGQLLFGLPDYKVPRGLLKQEIAQIVETRVTVRTGNMIEQVDDLIGKFDCVLLTLGQQRPKAAGFMPQGLLGVRWAVEFLRDVNFGIQTNVRGDVVILGGNNVAFDAARCAVRLGATTVTVLITGPRDLCEAHQFEIQAAEEEGVLVDDMMNLVDLEYQGRGFQLVMRSLQNDPRSRSGEGVDSSELGSRKLFQADLVLVSNGQEAEVPESWGLDIDPIGYVVSSSDEMMSSRPGVFAAGEVVTGPGSIVDAMDQGKRVAGAIDRYLGGDGDLTERFSSGYGDEMVMPHDVAVKGKSTVTMPTASLPNRKQTFKIVETGYTKTNAKTEARRCIRCDLWRHDIPQVWTEQDG